MICKCSTTKPYSQTSFFHFLPSFLFWDRISLSSPCCLRTHYTVHYSSLEPPVIFLPQPSKCWDYRNEPPCSAALLCCSPDWPWTHGNPPAAASWVLRLQVWAPCLIFKKNKQTIKSFMLTYRELAWCLISERRKENPAMKNFPKVFRQKEWAE